MEKIFINDGQPRNYATGREYSGRNAATLSGMDDTFFMTFVQGRTLGFRLHDAKGKSVHLLLVEPRKSEKDGEESRYFYKRGFVVFGLSLWRDESGAPIPEPEDGAAFPWTGKGEVFKEPETETETETLKEPGKEPEKTPEPKKTVKKTPIKVNGKKTFKRADFLKNASVFFKGTNKVYLQIKDGTAIFRAPTFEGDRLLMITDCAAPNCYAVAESKTMQAVIKGIDDFTDGIVKGKRLVYTCIPEDMSDFDISDAYESDTENVKGEIPADIIARVIHAAADDPIKPVFHGASIEPDHVVCSDSRRLSVIAYHTGVTEPAIIPYCIAKNAVGTVRIAARRAIASCEYGLMSAPLVDGQFPNWKRCIPDMSDAVVLPCSNDDWAALEKIAPAPSHKIALRPDGAYVADMDGDGKPCERKVADLKAENVGVNASYMRQAMKDESKVFLTGSMSPIVIKSGIVTDVVMPILIKNKEA